MADRLRFPDELAPPARRRFVVVGDLQRTSLAEVWRPSNRIERERLVERIAGEGPDLVLLLGDLVFCGSSAAHWADFDALSAPLAELGVPVLPIVGNHEYWMAGRASLRGLYQRFPALARGHWYTRTYGPVAFLATDSNRRRLLPHESARQLAFVKSQLGGLDADPRVRGVLLLTHHPPYTNSTVSPDDLWVQRELVPPFLAARKTLAMLSGHVHSYERFQREGRAFVVAGGGGPRVRLHQGDRRRHADDLIEGSAVRPFHYLVVALEDDGLLVEMHGLERKGETFHVHDEFRLPFAGSASRSLEVAGVPGARVRAVTGN